MFKNNPNYQRIVEQNNDHETDTILHYVHDPMCAWCWCFRPVWLEFQQLLKRQYPNLTINLLAGGLAPDNEQPMAADLRTKLSANWHMIELHYGVKFNHNFWQLNVPKRSTYWACRAVLSAAAMPDVMGDEKHHNDRQQKMIYEIQKAYYLQAKNPADLGVLINCAAKLGLAKKAFQKQLESTSINTLLTKHINFARSIGGNSFPSLIWEKNNTVHILPNEYHNAATLLNYVTKNLA